MTGIRSFIAGDVPVLDMAFAGAVVGEPTMLRALRAHNGVARWVVHTHGVAAHGAAPDLGRNAISMMVKLVDAIESRYVPGLTAFHPMTGTPVCGVNVIRGGTQPNIVPDHCEIQLDRRLVPGEEPGPSRAAFTAVLDEVKAAHEGLAYTFEEARSYPPLMPEMNEAFWPVVREALTAMQLDAEPIGAPFATHACHLGTAGIPAIVIGPGDPRTAHTRDEWVDLEQIHRGVELYGRLMRAACG